MSMVFLTIPRGSMTALRGFVTNRRQLGTRAALLWLFDRLAKRLMVFDVTHVMALDVNKIRTSCRPDKYVTYRFLTSGEIRDFAKDPANEIDGCFASRAAKGNDLCYAAFRDRRLAAYAWFALGSIESQHNRGTDLRSGVAVSFPHNAVFMYKGWTHPDCRGGGLYAALIGRALRELSPRGIERIVSTADWTNGPALRSCYRLGYLKLGLVCRCGWGHHVLTLVPRAARREGLRFGDDAVVTSR